MNTNLLTPKKAAEILGVAIGTLAVNLHLKMIHLAPLIAVNIEPPILISYLIINEIQLISSDQFSVQLLDQIWMQFNSRGLKNDSDLVTDILCIMKDLQAFNTN